MSFYKYFLFMTYTLLFRTTKSTGNKDLIIQKKGVETVRPCSIGLLMYADVNNTSNEDYEVEVTPDECCVKSGDGEDCSVVEVVGDCIETVSRGTVKTLRVVAPLIDPLERLGHCTLHFDSKPRHNHQGTMRDTVKISFDTRLKNSKQPMAIPANITDCPHIDEDPLNDCKPVDCESYYNGKKSFFDNKTKRCTNVVECLPDDSDDETPNVVYDVARNKCIGKSVTNKDIDLIKELAGNKPRKAKDILILRNLNRTPSTVDSAQYVTSIGDHLSSLRNETHKISQLARKHYNLNLDQPKNNSYNYAGLKVFMAKYFIAKKLTLWILGGVIFVQCCLIFSMIYYMGNGCSCAKKKKVVRKFFNYRQDASVTTPLINTSNIDTETTEIHLSDSSNIDKKIKCYKACQKERKNNVKMSMSDDILSKCLNRRDWNSKLAKSDAIQEVPLANEDIKRDTIETLNHYESLYHVNSSDQSNKQNNVKVNFENEKQKPKKEKKRNKMIKSIVKRIESNHSRRDSGNYDEIQGELSEREIQCHTYNYVENTSNRTGFNPAPDSKKFDYSIKGNSKKGTVSASIEKGAHASFSNDSIDDFLSERGLIYLAGDLSKYSLTSQSNEVNRSSLSSEVSSKTSKNNKIVKNVLSFLSRRSKQGPMSEPGVKKDNNINLELLHMSQASVYSSNNESDCVKGIKVTKDSRSSL